MKAEPSDTEGATPGLAVYTTMYPGMRPYLADWYRSVVAQTDRDFELWIGLDGLDPEEVQIILGCRLQAYWVKGTPGDTPADIRQRALSLLVDRCAAVVLVDSDDVLHPSRVAAAREALSTCDLTACGLRLVDEAGMDLGRTVGLPQGVDPEDVLPRYNVFGLSNSAYRSSLLRRCLPIPSSVVLVDWFLATRAWLLAAAIGFDPRPRMDYRQYGNNMVRVTPPFAEEQVSKDTSRVMEHLASQLASLPEGARTERIDQLRTMVADVRVFEERVVQDGGQLQRYVTALNSLAPPSVWWAAVAHPMLKYIWAPPEGDE